MRLRSATLFLIASLATALVACGDPSQQASTRDAAGSDTTRTTTRDATTHTAPPPTTTTTEPASDDIRWDSLGLGTWQGARTGNGGKDVVIVLVGGKAFDPDNPCSIAYHARVTETATEVRVELGQSSPPDRRPPPPPGVGYGCTLEGHTRYVPMHLAGPLGTRTLIEEQFHRPHPVFDGDALAEVTWTPDGWHPGSEGPRTAGDEPPPAWTRSYGPDRPEGRDGHCTPTDAGFVLTQQRAANEPPDPAANEEVHGAPATYRDAQYEPGLPWTSLTWAEHGWLYIVESRPGCVGDTSPSKETILRFARSLRVR